MNGKTVFAAMAALCLAPGLAQATDGQEPPPNRITSGSQDEQAYRRAGGPANPDTISHPEGQPTAAIPQLQGAADVAHALLNAGVSTHLTLVNDLAGNPTGGLRQGYSNAGVVRGGADFDMNKLLGLKGGKIHLELIQYYGKSISSAYIGDAIKVQGAYYPFEQFNLAQLGYEQTLFDNKLDILAGRINATSTFNHATFGCQFVGHSQCPNQLSLTTGSLSAFPYVTWGTKVRVNPTRTFYIQTGVFEIDPKRHLDDGFDWSTTEATGVTVPVEFGYGTDFSNDNYPRHLKVGGWYNNARYNDPLLTTRGLSKVFFPGAPLNYEGGRGGVWLLGDQVLWRPDATRRNLAVFGSYSAPFDQREFYHSLSTAGAMFTGPLASRPRDTMGAMVTWIDFTGRETELMNDTLEKAGSRTFVQRDELMFELNYSYRIIRGLSTTPNIQYIVNPDISQHMSARFAPKDAFVIGWRLVFNFGDMLGLPSATAEE
jgi:porin